LLGFAYQLVSLWARREMGGLLPAMLGHLFKTIFQKRGLLFPSAFHWNSPGYQRN
jgi:hypothetical protein